MKFLTSLLLGLTTGAIALTATPTFSQSSSEIKVRVGCKKIQNVLITSAYIKENQEPQIPLIHWRNEYIDSKNIEEDCKNASEILQNRYNEGKLAFSTIDRNSNNQIVFCLLDELGDSCNLNSSKELVRLKPTVKAENLDKIVDRNLALLDKNGLRRYGRIYPKIQSKSWLEKLINFVGNLR